MHRSGRASTLLATTFCMLAGNSLAQDTAPAPAPPSTAPGAPPTTTGPQISDPSPYYIGVNQAITHDTNVFRVPSSFAVDGRSDTISSTSLVAGFDQPISRQRVFGSAAVGYNRYFSHDELNNTSYNLAAGLAFQTINKISGGLNIGLNRSLAQLGANGVTPLTRKNSVQTETIDGRVRYGGDSLLSLEGTAAYAKVDYSDPAYLTAESSNKSASLGLYYHPGGPLRVGIAGRFTRATQPNAILLSDGSFRSNSVDGRNIDLNADYEVSGFISASARVSYTRQSNSNIEARDFSGLTYNVNVNYRPTGKLSFNLYAARDAGINGALYNTYTVTQTSNGIVITPVTGLYENSQTTDSVSLGVGYAATAKIAANASVRYSRAKLVVNAAGQPVGQGGADTTDIVRGASIGATYAATRNWQFACSASHESRSVGGGISYSYTANTVGCSAQFTLR